MANAPSFGCRLRDTGCPPEACGSPGRCGFASKGDGDGEVSGRRAGVEPGCVAAALGTASSPAAMALEPGEEGKGCRSLQASISSMIFANSCSRSSIFALAQSQCSVALLTCSGGPVGAVFGPLNGGRTASSRPRPRPRLPLAAASAAAVTAAGLLGAAPGGVDGPGKAPPLPSSSSPSSARSSGLWSSAALSQSSSCSPPWCRRSKSVLVPLREPVAEALLPGAWVSLARCLSGGVLATGALCHRPSDASWDARCPGGVLVAAEASCPSSLRRTGVASTPAGPLTEVLRRQRRPAAPAELGRSRLTRAASRSRTAWKPMGVHSLLVAMGLLDGLPAAGAGTTAATSGVAPVPAVPAVPAAGVAASGLSASTWCCSGWCRCRRGGCSSSCGCCLSWC